LPSASSSADSITRVIFSTESSAVTDVVRITLRKRRPARLVQGILATEGDWVCSMGKVFRAINRRAFLSKEIL
jgi:hypothetical protein